MTRKEMRVFAVVSSFIILGMMSQMALAGRGSPDPYGRAEVDAGQSGGHYN